MKLINLNKEVYLKKLIINLSSNGKPVAIIMGPVVKDKLVNKEIFGDNFEKPEKTKFSRRELEVLELVCKERTNTEIARLLGVSIRTVETHRRKMVEKTGSKSMIGVIVAAVQLNMTISSTGYTYPDDFGTNYKRKISA